MTVRGLTLKSAGVVLEIAQEILVDLNSFLNHETILDIFKITLISREKFMARVSCATCRQRLLSFNDVPSINLPSKLK